MSFLLIGSAHSLLYTGALALCVWGWGGEWIVSMPGWLAAYENNIAVPLYDGGAVCGMAMSMLLIAAPSEEVHSPVGGVGHRASGCCQCSLNTAAIAP